MSSYSLNVWVIAARNLKNVQTFGTQDPFVKLTLKGASGRELKWQSPFHNDGGINPTWNQKKVFNNVTAATVASGHLIVKVCNKNNVKDTLIGQARVNFTSPEVRSGKLVDKWLSLENGGRLAGEIRMKFQLEDQSRMGKKQQQLGKAGKEVLQQSYGVGGAAACAAPPAAVAVAPPAAAPAAAVPVPPPPAPAAAPAAAVPVPPPPASVPVPQPQPVQHVYPTMPAVQQVAPPRPAVMATAVPVPVPVQAAPVMVAQPAMAQAYMGAAPVYAQQQVRMVMQPQQQIYGMQQAMPMQMPMQMQPQQQIYGMQPAVMRPAVVPRHAPRGRFY